MELVCYLHTGWEPRIRPATQRRDWMDAAPEAFPYRCLPLGIANSLGWELLSPCGFEAIWNGGGSVEDVTITCDAGTRPIDQPVALFGQGTFTIHVQGLLRTEPGWNLWVGGPPNVAKDGVAPLTGLIETDWSPYTFTMNWRLTRPNHPIRFEENEPIAHFFPVRRDMIEAVQPRYVQIDAAPALKAAFEEWSRSRDAFHQRMKEEPPEKPADKWQKLYYRGLTPAGVCPVQDHKTKWQVREFDADKTNADAVATSTPVEPKPELEGGESPDLARTKLEWLLAAQEKQRTLSTAASGVFRREGVSSQAFLDQYYAPGRPVVLAGAIADWPALTAWTPEALRARFAGRPIEYQGGRNSSEDFERTKDEHTRRMPFDQFIDMIMREAGNDAYVTAYNSLANQDMLRALSADVRLLPELLDQTSDDPGGMVWIGPAGTFTPLHHDLTNNLLVQVTGRKRVILASAVETPNLYNDRHVFSQIRDVTDPNLDLDAYPRLKEVGFTEVILEAGEALFIPLGWWHQVEALSFCVSITYTNFRWPNEGYLTYPKE